jgi:hypothetical protein
VIKPFFRVRVTDPIAKVPVTPSIERIIVNASAAFVFAEEAKS